MTHEAGIEAARHEFFKEDGFFFERFPEALQAYLSASGMVLVPREPTEDMLQAAKREPLTIIERDVYTAMVNAAPDPFKSKP